MYKLNSTIKFTIADKRAALSSVRLTLFIPLMDVMMTYLYRAFLLSIVCGFLMVPGMAFGVGPGHIPFFDDFLAEKTTRVPARIFSLDDQRAPLLDPDQRVPSQFTVPAGLERRTQFWFDIYTRYDSDQHVVHHKKYPWIVFSVIDTRQFATARGTMWTTFNRSKKYVRKGVLRIKNALWRLSKMKSYKKLNPLEKQLYVAVSKLKGPIRRNFRKAGKNVRTQLGQRDFFVDALRRSTKYLPYMEEIFEAHNLPAELTRIPFVESSFNTRAYSKVGASGVWQIMPRTGRRYIRISRNIDERNSPIKATRAAAKLLKNYHKRLKQWPITVTGYNHGVGGMNRAVRRTKSHDLSLIIKVYKRKSFGFASSNFYASFLAALHAEKYSAEIFLKDKIKRKKLQLFSLIKLKKSMRPNLIVKLLGISLMKFQNYNLDLRKAIRKNTLLPKGFEIHLPPEANLSSLTLKSKKKLVTKLFKSNIQKPSN